MKKVSIPYEEYFDVMDIDIVDKKKRVALAMELEDALLLFFLLFREGIATGYKSKRYMVGILRTNIINKLAEIIELDDYIYEHLDEFIDDVYKVTEKNVSDIENVNTMFDISNGKDFSDEFLKEVEELSETNGDRINLAFLLWFLSNDRAKAIAENESNLIWNYEEFKEAIQDGKTHKTWMTERDNKVRPTHMDVDREKIPINDAFYVGGSMMMFPKDSSMGAGMEEIANCRCWLEYT